MTNQAENQATIVLLDHRYGWDEDFTESQLRRLLEERGVEFVTEPEFSPLTVRDQFFMPDGFALANGAYVYPKMHLCGSDKMLHLVDEWVASSESENDNTAMTQGFALVSTTMSNAAKALTEFDYSECKAEHDYECSLTIPLSFFDFIQSQEAFIAFMENCDWSTPEHIEEMKVKYSY